MSFEDEYSGRDTETQKTTIKAFLPVMGFFLLIAIGAVSYVLSEPVHDLLIENMDGIPADIEVQYLVAGVMFVVLLMFVGMLYAAFAPKPQKQVTEAELKRERVAVQREKKAQQRRRQQVNRKMAEARKQSDKQR